jgi:HK97 family phage major capsid protein
VAQVYRNNFVPNYIVVHPDRLASMEMMKASDGHYIMPPFKSADGTAIAAVPVIANNGVAQGSFFVGDFNKYKARIKEGLSIAIGYDGNDWTNNMVTPLAEMRLVGYIASNNYGAIVTGTFTVGKALLDPAVADS